MWRNVQLVVMEVVAIGGVVGCSRSERLADVGVKEGILHLGNGAEPPDLDLHVVTGVPEFHIMDALFEGLVDIDPETQEPAPGVVQRWELSEDGRVYTFYLWPEAKWSDGVALTAEDFVRSYERIMNPALGSESMPICLRSWKEVRGISEGRRRISSEWG
ncbi:MAG: hypothetical protein J6386_19830 [Candidatus Synoicihabitans palmerolidicus]|nr:hypothetical protein [Candidatus Synoicihabitans palmerolidicus]